MKFTPGPWKLKEHPSGHLTDIYTNRNPCTLATTAFHGWAPEEMEANARLIISAHNLLAACKTALIHVNGGYKSTRDRITAGDHLADILQAAIAKAEEDVL